MSELVLPITAEFDVTCHSTGCENAEIVIRVSAAQDNPFVICGPCGVQIEDVVAA